MIEFCKRACLLTLGVATALVLVEILTRVTATFLVQVNYLATAGVKNMPPAYISLEQFLSENRVHIQPHRVWYNYYANSLGFTDREFALEKQKGRLRIMALGDSFLYGWVAYPQNVLTLTESLLRKKCGERNLETMNFGIPASGVREYRIVHKLAAPRYKPDIVVIHFYMGNDGPDLISLKSLPWIGRRILMSSYAWNFIKNYLKVLWSTNDLRIGASGVVALPAAGERVAQGGERVTGQPDITDDEFRPTFTQEAFASLLANELGRLYRGKKTMPAGFDAWQETLDVLDALRAEVIASTGRKPIIVLYPSRLQVYPELFEATKRAVATQNTIIDPTDFDSNFPVRVLFAYCQRAGLSCYDVTPAMI